MMKKAPMKKAMAKKVAKKSETKKPMVVVKKTTKKMY